MSRHRQSTALVMASPAMPTAKPPAVAIAEPFDGSEPVRRAAWLKVSNLKFEAVIFLLIALTFGAVLGQEGITRQETDLAARAGQYYPFTYGDHDEGGKSTISHDPAQPLKWSCTLRAGTEYAYCGYGLQLDSSGENIGVDFSKYNDIGLNLSYHGVGDHMRLLVQAAVPPSLQARVNGADTIPMVAEFAVAQGDNLIHLRQDQFVVEEWWLTSHKLAREEVPVNFEHVVSVALSSGSTTPYGRFEAVVKSFTLKGASVSSAHWYLIILGIWLVLTGGFWCSAFLICAEPTRPVSVSRPPKARPWPEPAPPPKRQALPNHSSWPI